MHNTDWGLFNGDSWEEMMQVIFKEKFADVGYQQIVTLPKGDHGIEGFTRKGDVFQCYCPNQDYPNDTLHEKQQDKINTDLKKLKTNEVKLKKKLGDILVQRWIFVVPRQAYNTLLDYCVGKREEIRSSSNSIIHPDFDILIHDGGHFDKEISQYQKRRHGPLTFDDRLDLFELIPNPTENSLVSTIDTKNRVVEADPSRLARRNSFFEKNLISGNELLRKILEKDPLTFRGIKRTINQLENELEFELLTWSDTADELIARLKNQIENKMSAEVPELSTNERSSIAMHVISRWIAFCPLKFEE